MVFGQSNTTILFTLDVRVSIGQFTDKGKLSVIIETLSEESFLLNFNEKKRLEIELQATGIFDQGFLGESIGLFTDLWDATEGSSFYQSYSGTLAIHSLHDNLESIFSEGTFEISSNSMTTLEVIELGVYTFVTRDYMGRTRLSLLDFNMDISFSLLPVSISQINGSVIDYELKGGQNSEEALFDFGYRKGTRSEIIGE